MAGAVRVWARVIVKHILRKDGYPVDKQENADPEMVLEQVELLGWEAVA